MIMAYVSSEETTDAIQMLSSVVTRKRNMPKWFETGEQDNLKRPDPFCSQMSFLWLFNCRIDLF